MAERRQGTARRRSSGGKGGSRSGGSRKKTSGGTKQATGSRPTQASKGTRKTPARTTATRKSAATEAPARAQLAPKSFEASALRAAARPPTPPPPAPVAPRRSGLGAGAPVFIGALLIAVAGVVTLIMILTSGDEENTTVDTSPPPAIALTPGEAGVTPDKAQPPAEPGSEPATRTASCEPIIGSGAANSGKTYAVTSSATDGDPAGCGEARSVLLSALNGGGTTIGEWSCTTDPSGPTIASCTSEGGRKILARG
jgi:hypothetical protein